MLERIAGNGVRIIIVETASRFARDLIVQETGWRFLQGLGVTLVAADSPDSFLDTTPTAVLIRQVLGAVSQFEKAALVAKLKSARDRKKRETGKCGGRKSYAERDGAMVMLAKKLARYPVNGASAHCATSRSSCRRRATSTSGAQCSTRSRSCPCWGGCRKAQVLRRMRRD